MGKTYIDTIKYVINGKIKIEGIVKKPDVVGAIFGQTEGLLGDDLDLRELQKSGRIGRIEVQLETKSGKTKGTFTLPSGLDKSQTAVLGAALETVDKVGPCESEVEIESIKDTRASKRDFVVGRAKELLGDLEKEMPESQEISTEVKDSMKKAKAQAYGKEKLSAGPDIDNSKDIIVVEGRADVLNLLSKGINNAISLKGSKIPKTVRKLSKKKETTLFVDGDRGGDIIVEEFKQLGDPDYVTKAPRGKEVEELTQKEILKRLRKSIPIDEYKTKSKKKTRKKKASKKKTSKKYDKHYKKVEENMKAVLLDKKGKEIKSVPIAEMIEGIKSVKKSKNSDIRRNNNSKTSRSSGQKEHRHTSRNKEI